MTKLTLFGLICILLLAFLLSSKMILMGDFFYLADQARDYLLVKDIIYSNHITLIGTHSGLGGFFHGPLWLYMLVPVYLLGNGDPFAFTYFYILLSLLTVAVGFLAGLKLYNARVGLFVAFLLALSPAIWSYVPNTIGVNVVPLVFIGIFYFLIKYIRGERRSYLGAVFFAGLSLQFETALPLIIVPIVVATFFINRKSIKDIRLILLSILSFLISVSTFILFELRHSFLMSRAVLGFVTDNQKNDGYMNLIDRFLSHLSSLFGVYKSVFFNSSLTLITLGAVISLIFVVFLVKRRNGIFSEWIYLLLFPVFVMILYLSYPYPVWPEYLLGLSVPVIFALSISMSYLFLSEKYRIVLFLFILVSLFHALSYIKQPIVANTTSGSYQNQKNVVEWIYEDSKGEEFGYFVYSPNAYTYGMDYLFSYLGEKEYGYTPKNEKRKDTYLIMYPPLQGDLNAHDYWKEKVLYIDATSSARREFRGGIIVEKVNLSSDTKPVDANYHQNLIFR